MKSLFLTGTPSNKSVVELKSMIHLPADEKFG